MNLMPKIELHCHLDGSMRKETVLEFIEKEGLDTDLYNVDNIEDALIAPADCDSLVTYLKTFKLPLQVLQTYDNLERTAFEIMEDAALENVKYIEIRFAPQLHREKGMSYEEIISSVSDGIKRAEARYQIKGNIILSYLRHESEDEFFEVIEAGRQYLGDKVVAVDLCGAEDKDFCKNFKEAVKYAKLIGYKVTIHAGETGIVENIIEAVDMLNADRIGHGIAMFNDRLVLEMVKSKNIFIECCPNSNVQTKAVKDIKSHPVDFYLNNGIKISLNTDNRTVSNTNMTNEFYTVANNFDWNKSNFWKVYEYSIEASFADADIKKWLIGFKDDIIKNGI